MRKVAMAAVLALVMPCAAAAQDAAAVKKGQGVYTAQKCSTCHAIAGKGSKANPLDGVGSCQPRNQTVDRRSRGDDRQGEIPQKPPMPKKYTALPAADLDALVAYMQSLK
jgi:mono/diheme cytochrome c family protein